MNMYKGKESHMHINHDAMLTRCGEQQEIFNLCFVKIKAKIFGQNVAFWKSKTIEQYLASMDKENKKSLSLCSRKQHRPLFSKAAHSVHTSQQIPTLSTSLHKQYLKEQYIRVTHMRYLMTHAFIYLVQIITPDIIFKLTFKVNAIIYVLPTSNSK